MGPMVGLDGYGNLFPTGIRSSNRPPFSESLYRLSYRGPLTGIPSGIINYVTSEFGITMTLYIDKTRCLQYLPELFFL